MAPDTGHPVSGRWWSGSRYEQPCLEIAMSLPAIDAVLTGFSL